MRFYAPLLALTLVAGLGAAPARADDHSHHHGGHSAATSLKPKQVTSQTLDAGQLSVVLLDARAFFNDMHKMHMGHPGIPTHQMQVKAKAPLKALKVVSPAGQKSEAYLRSENGTQVADVELRKPGRYTFELLKRDGRMTRWQYTVR